ncbi:MAG TPA: PAS domain-containing protein, partial [Thermomicrobiales bacterium]|nr:PAS domain-containing protein [Thermomicrobiales bacterium]
MSAELLIRLPDYFPSLINAMQDGVVLRGTDGTIVETNQAFCMMVGFDRSEIVGARPPHPWWPDEERERFEDARERYLAGVSTEDDLLYMRRDGVRFPAVVTNAPLRDSEDRVIAYIATIKDMSERVKAEEQIRFQAALIDQVEASVIATDVAGTILFWNRGAETLYGWQQDEVIGKAGQDLLLGPGADGVVEELIQTFSSGSSWEGEIVVPHRDGSLVPVYLSSSAVRDPNGRPVGIVAVLVDISERARAAGRIAAQ